MTGHVNPKFSKVPLIRVDAVQTQQPWHDTQTLHPSLDDPGDRTGHGKQLYRPIWLTPHFLIALTLIFTATWVTLIIMFHVVSSQNGLSFTITSSHYAWTYGPSTILILLLGVWRQVDYHCKLTQPWRQMMSGPSHPDRSVLLDYVSPMQVVSLARSLNRKHFPVALSVTGFGVLKLAILVSTTLFVPEETLHLQQRPVQYKSSFDASYLWSNIPMERGWTGWTDAGGEIGFYPPTREDFPLGDRLIWGYIAQLNGRTLDPTKVMENMVYQSFGVLGSNENITSTTADVDVFQPNITCEDAEVGISVSDKENSDLAVSMTVRSNSCSEVFQDSIILTRVRPQTLFYGVSIVNCSTDRDDTRILVTVLDIRPTLFSNGSYSNATLNKATSLVCKADFSLGKADSTQAPLGNPVGLTHFRPNPAAIDLDSSQLARLLYTSLFRSTRIQTEDDPPEEAGAFETLGAFPVMFLLMRKSMGLNSGWDELFDGRKLSQAVTSVLGGLTLHLGLTLLLRPAQADLEGIGMVTISQNKLHFRKEPLFLMTACFVLLAFISFTTLLLVRKRAVPQRPGSIASHATILSTSPSVINALYDTGHLRTSQLRRKLQDVRFHVVVTDDKYSIEATSSAEASRPEVTSLPGKQKKPDDWIPFATRIPMLVTLFLFPCAVIAALEFLQRLSNDNNGVAHLSGNGSGNATVPIYAARLSSTLVIFLVAMLFNNMDFSIATFTPFSALRYGGATARQASISVNLVGETPVMALYKSFRYRYFGTALSLIAALLGSLLTIMVSGLWIVDSQVMLPTAVTAEAAAWNLAWSNNSSNDNGAARLLNTIDFGGTTVPTTIWEGHVLPNILSWSTAAPNEEGKIPLSDFKLKIPSLRPVLDCTTARREDITYRNSSVVVEGSNGPSGHNRHVPTLAVQARFDLPSGCWANPSRNSSNAILGFEWYYNSVVGNTLIGHILDVDTGPLENSSTQLLSETGCPSLGFVFGDIHNLTAILCSQKMQIVELEANYPGDPSLDVRDSRPTSYTKNTSDGTPIFARDLDSGLPTFQYRINQHLQADLRPIDSANQQDISVDTTFKHFFYGALGTNDKNALLGPENVHLIAAVNEMYNRYMTLVIDLNFRPPSPNATKDQGLSVDASKAAAAVSGTATQQVTRLKMNNGSKLTLQIMLGVMLLLMAVAVKMVRIRGTLPRNPLNIASVMGFLAGSTLCDPVENAIPPGAEFLSRKDLAQLFEGPRYSLGWWARGPSRGQEANHEHSWAGSSMYERESGDERNGYSSSVDLRAFSTGSRFGIDVGSASETERLIGDGES